MEFKVSSPSNFLPKLIWRLRKWSNWNIVFDKSSITLFIKKRKKEIDYTSIKNLEIKNKTKLILKLDNIKNISLICPNNIENKFSALDLCESFQIAIQNYIKYFLNNINLPDKSPYDLNKYISSHNLKTWVDSLPDTQQINKILDLCFLSNFDYSKSSKHEYKQLDLLYKYCEIVQKGDETRKEHNENFIHTELDENQNFFDNVEKQPLTLEQRISIIEMEDRNLLVAAAGSGKTSAIVGKVGYSLKTKFCQPNEILVMAFNKKAVKELRSRLDVQLGKQAKQVVVSTFHKLGLDIIGKASARKPSIATWTTNLGESSSSNNYWEKLIDELLKSDAEFKNLYIQLNLYFNYEMIPQHQFKSQNDYENYLESVGAKRKNNDYWEVETIQGERVNSLQELAIANWLYAHNVDYKYESQYKHETANSEYRSYKPDFYYPKAEIYHEHFALDEYGKPPIYFDNYLDGVSWKRQIHKNFNTKLIETTSHMFSQGIVFDHLRKELEEQGIDCSNQRSSFEIENTLTKRTIKPIHKLIQEFLKQWKLSTLSIEELFEKSNRLSGYAKNRANIFLKVVDILRKAYEDKLIKNNEIDFENMINQATEYLNRKTFQHPYRLILVDEFQDISQSRSQLIKSLLKQKADCILFAVGDDWQSIYRFNGSDINIMTNFQKEFGTTSRNDLTMTFRSNKGITDTATKFISANPSQLNKNVISSNDTTESVINLIYYKSPETVEILIQQQLNDIFNKGKAVNILILGRYGFRRPDNIDRWNKEFGKLLNIQFLTIHSAKGMEADYVFIMRMESGYFGFPSNRAEDSLLNLVKPVVLEEYKFAEERRLFYVALTRAKHQVFILGNHTSISPFVKEIMAYDNIHNNKIVKEHFIDERGMPYSPLTDTTSDSCPKCGGGMVARKSKYGKFFGCLNYPKCNGTHKISVSYQK